MGVFTWYFCPCLWLCLCDFAASKRQKKKRRDVKNITKVEQDVEQDQCCQKEITYIQENMNELGQKYVRQWFWSVKHILTRIEHAVDTNVCLFLFTHFFFFSSSAYLSHLIKKLNFFPFDFFLSLFLFSSFLFLSFLPLFFLHFFFLSPHADFLHTFLFLTSGDAAAWLIVFVCCHVTHMAIAVFVNHAIAIICYFSCFLFVFWERV